jgi:hypothetical protein
VVVVVAELGSVAVALMAEHTLATVAEMVVLDKLLLIILATALIKDLVVEAELVDTQATVATAEIMVDIQVQ